MTRNIGNKLNASTILEGSVRKSGNSLRITAQFINSYTGFHIWSEKFDRKIGDVFQIQDEIADAICHKLEEFIPIYEYPKDVEFKQPLMGVQHGSISRDYKIDPKGIYFTITKPRYKKGSKETFKRFHGPRPIGLPHIGIGTSFPSDNESYDIYLKAKSLLNKGIDNLRDSIFLFKESISLDNSYVPAYLGLSKSFIKLGYWGLDTPSKCYPRAKLFVEQVIEIDNSISGVYFDLSIVNLVYDWDTDLYVENIKKAILLNKNNSEAIAWNAYYYTSLIRGNH